MELDIGIERKAGTHRFKIYVCNEGGFLEILHQIHSQYIFASFNNLLVITEFNDNFIINQLKERIEKINGKSWEEIAAKFSTFLEYEFSPNTPGYD